MRCSDNRLAPAHGELERCAIAKIAEDDVSAAGLEVVGLGAVPRHRPNFFPGLQQLTGHEPAKRAGRSYDENHSTVPTISRFPKFALKFESSREREVRQYGGGHVLFT